MTVRRRTPNRNLPRGNGWETKPATVGGQRSLLTQRAALVLITALVIGAAAGILAYLAGARPAGAVLTGGAACAAAIALLNTVIA